MSDAQEWIDDLTDADPDDDGDESSSSLFEDNFRKLVEENDIKSMTVSTLEGQIDRIDDAELLAEAAEQDTRTTAQDVYQDRLGEVNTEKIEEEDESEGSGEEADPEATPETIDDGDEEEGDEDPKELAEPIDGDDDEGEDDDGDGGMAEDLLDDAEDAVDGSVDSEGEESGSGTSSDGSDDEADQDPSAENETALEPTQDALPDVDVGSLAPDAVSREAAADAEKQRTMLVWGPEGSGKSHIAHSAPEPVVVIDTEGKADELAEKFDKRIHYFHPSDYKEAKDALDQAIDLLDAYLDQGVRGTLVVDSISVMWEWAQIDYAKFAYQTEKLSEVNFKSQLQGEKDWSKIKARHNEEFRDYILDQPFHVVFTAGQKDAYGDNFEAQKEPDGEKHNKYAVKDVVRLRRGEDGKTVADLRKAAKTRYSFVGLEWPTWDKVYDAISQISEAEQADEEIDLSDWDFGVVDGQPVSSEGSGDDGGEDS